MSIRRREPSLHNNVSWDLKREKRGVCTWLLRPLPLHSPSPMPWLTCARRRHWRACSFSPPSPLLLPLDSRDRWRRHQWRLNKGLNSRSIASSLSYNMQRRAWASSQILNWCSIEREITKRSTSSQNFELVIWSLKLTINGWDSLLDLKRWC
jgi:hypothetical protein